MFSKSVAHVRRNQWCSLCSASSELDSDADTRKACDQQQQDLKRSEILRIDRKRRVEERETAHVDNKRRARASIAGVVPTTTEVQT